MVYHLLVVSSHPSNYSVLYSTNCPGCLPIANRKFFFICTTEAFLPIYCLLKAEIVLASVDPILGVMEEVTVLTVMSLPSCPWSGFLVWRLYGIPL